MSMSALTAYRSSLSLNLRTAETTASAVADRRSPAKAGGDAPASGSGGASVILSLSAEAQQVMASAKAGTDAPASRYAAYFPTRDGKPANALGRAVEDPGALSSSAGLTLAQAAKDARARMDAQYKAMDDSGKPFDPDAYEGRDWNTVMGDLDRRSLFAISSNTEGLFSEQEQQKARDLMLQQQGLASGLYNGPTRLAGTFGNPLGGDITQQMKAGIKFLDRVSNEEKASLDWSVDRASAQKVYEANADDTREQLEKLDSESPLAQLVKTAMDTMKGNRSRGISNGHLRTFEDLKRQPWFEGFEGQLDSAIARTRALYLKGSAAQTA